MITNTNNVGSSPIPSPDPRRNRASVAAPATPAEDTLSTENATHLKAALANTPAIRPEVVERASKLAIDPAYPPLAIIEKVARMISDSNDLSAE
jgi:hypothetical protein